MNLEIPDALRYSRTPLIHGSGTIPAAGFGTLIPDPLLTKQATKTALEMGFQHPDCAERYRNEAAVGGAMQEVFRAGTMRREDIKTNLRFNTVVGTGVPGFIPRARWN
jgi:diketogulonate reductase-like aldo/keto reductase